MTPFRRKDWDLAKLRSLLAEKERLAAAAKDDSESDPRLALTVAIALRRMIAASEAGVDPSSPLELQGLRLGPLALLASPFETFQAIKNDIVRGSRAGITLVASFGNDCVGYAVDHTAAARGGYAADLSPVLYGKMPFASVHDDLVAGMLAVDGELDRLAQERTAGTR
jgi:hypothetical protein